MNPPDASRAIPTKPKDDPTIWRVDDALWAASQPLLGIDKPRKKPGRPRLDDRPIFDGLIWLARNGGQWATLPREFGAKSTVHARFQEWVEHGCLAHAWTRLLAVYDGAVGLDWQWQAADGCLVKAPLGKKGPPVRRRRPARTPPTGASVASSATS
jgi:putative transposase